MEKPMTEKENSDLQTAWIHEVWSATCKEKKVAIRKGVGNTLNVFIARPLR